MAGTQTNPNFDLDIDAEIDWTLRERIEQVPGKLSCRPVVLGPRILPDAILNSFELGDSPEEIREGLPSLTLAHMERLVEFGSSQLHQRQS